MNTEMRIKDSKEFNEILNTGKKIYSNYYFIYYKEKKKENPRFGITQVKKFGKAFKRNRFHRLLREIIRTNQNLFKKDYDYIIIIRKSCDTLNFKQLESELFKLIKERLWKRN